MKQHNPLHLSGCPHCDLLIQRSDEPANHTVVCPRCGYVLSRRRSRSLDKTLALAITGLLLYLPAMFLPLITLNKLGLSEQANVLDTIIRFFHEEYYFVSAMTLISAAALPLCLLLLAFIVCLHLKTGTATTFTARLFRGYLHLEEWAMVEVYLLGILITIIKMKDLADVTYNAGFFTFIALVFITLGITVVMDKTRFWEIFAEQCRPTPQNDDLQLEKSAMNHSTAFQAGFATCLTCHQLIPIQQDGSPPDHCTRCGDTLHVRKPSSIARTLALVITSSLFFLPANILPIMEVEFLGVTDRSTIIDGILLFFEDGSYGIGLIIMVASVLVPLFKIVGLTILVSSARFGFSGFLPQKTVMFRFISFIGRWSMLDIFVIALLISLVDFGFFTTISAAPAATFFCLVVAATMLAANTFDPRLMWDRMTYGSAEVSTT